MEAGTQEQEQPQGAIPDAQLEAQVMARRARREEKEQEEEDREPRRGRELLKAAQAGAEEESDLSAGEAADALEHFMATEDDEGTVVEPKTLKLNLGTKAEPQWVRWTIVPVEDTEITRIRKNSVIGTRAQRRRGDAESDEALVSRRLVVKGTVDPDPKALAKTMNLLDPADAVQAFFRKYGKTGLITQVSGEILSISGWDDEDVQEVEAARG